MKGTTNLTNALIPAVVTAGICLILSACGSVTAHLSPRSASFVLAFFDVSGTTKAVRNGYLEDANAIVEQLQPGDRFWAEQITDNTLATARIPLQVNLQTFNPLTQNHDEYDKQIQQRKTQVSSELQGLLQGNTNKSAILDSLLLAQKVFHGSQALVASRRVLVLFSDMLEDSNRYRFDREALTPDRIKLIVAREQAEHRIANLKGVVVYVAGATADRSVDPSRIGRVQAFWQAYFQAAGAELADEHYSASLLDFVLPGAKQK